RQAPRSTARRSRSMSTWESGAVPRQCSPVICLTSMSASMGSTEASGRRSAMLDRPSPLNRPTRTADSRSSRICDSEDAMKDLFAKAETLMEALPWIKHAWGRTVVIKYGGAAMTDPSLRDAVAADIVLMKLVGVNPVVVHGG